MMAGLRDFTPAAVRLAHGWRVRGQRALRRIRRLGPPGTDQRQLLAGANLDTRQQRRRAAFVAALGAVTEGFPYDPRRARRRIARAWAKRGIP